MSFEIAKFVLERVSDLLKHEATLLLVDEKKEIQSLERELQLIEGFFKDIDLVERQEILSNRLQIKLQHLKRTAHDVEDFLDRMIDQKWQRVQRERKKGCAGCFKPFFSRKSNPLLQKHDLATTVAGIRSSLQKILHDSEGYQLPNTSSQVTNRRKRRATNPYIAKDEIIIGLEEDVSTLVARFLGKDGKPAANTAIVGMGGSGKTTLAKLFYNHEEIQEAFPAGRAWVCVSQEWNARELQIQICKMLGVRLSKDDWSNPHVKLQKRLKRRTCLIVLDDVWDKNDVCEQNALVELLRMLLSGRSRVLVTTRKEKVVRFKTMGPFYLHRARHLTQEQSWELFSRVVLNCCDGGVNFEADDGYEKFGKEMLLKCDGLPLAIVTLGGLLATKGTVQQWKDIKDHVTSKIMDDKCYHDYGAVKTILELSYSDLPYHMKPCFLYLGTFQEDSEIAVTDLIGLWIDEGLIKLEQCPEGGTPEEVAKEILEDLVQRCMVQVTNKNGLGEAQLVRIHDLMRDLCIVKAREFGFFEVFSPSSTSSTQIREPSYRAIFYDRWDVSISGNKRLRTLICINQCTEAAVTLRKELFPFETLKLLRILKLEGVQMDDWGRHIGDMVLLKHLQLLHCNYKTTDMDFIKKLRNLQVLILDGYSSAPGMPGRVPLKLPDNMVGRMEQLRFLHLRVQVKNPRWLLGTTNIMNLKLKTLCVEADDFLDVELAEAMSISSLRDLTFWNICSQARLNTICGSVGNASARLETLSISLGISATARFDLQMMELEGFQRLNDLSLEGKILKQHKPAAVLLPPNLIALYLKESDIEEEEGMQRVLAGLDHLRVLRLDRYSYKGDKLTLIGLPQLQVLCLAELENLKEWIIPQGSLPQLKEIRLHACFELERIPDEIGNIHTLQLLHVSHMPERFCKRLQKREDIDASNGGEDFHLVQHIPAITFGPYSYTMADETRFN